MYLKNKMKQIKILFFVFFLAPGASKALNLFEMFMIKTGVALVYYQYNDKSLDYETEFSKKNKVLSNYYQNKIFKANSGNFNNLPIQQQMLIIEELNLQK